MPGRTTNIDTQSLRGFLGMVEPDYPDELLRIRVPVRHPLDITSLVFELERAGKSPVVVYENVGKAGMPVVTNIAGNRKLLAACLGVGADRAADRVSRALPEVHPVRDRDAARRGRRS